MKKENRENKPTDLEECQLKIQHLLAEYNCELISADEWHSVLIRDLDTDKTVNINR